MDSQLVGSYDYRVVLLSIGIAVVGSYAALDLGEQIAPGRPTRQLWLIGPATVLGLGIWAMHYTGMLSFRLPIPMRYDWLIALLSFVPALHSWSRRSQLDCESPSRTQGVAACARGAPAE